MHVILLLYGDNGLRVPESSEYSAMHWTQHKLLLLSTATMTIKGIIDLLLKHVNDIKLTLYYCVHYCVTTYFAVYYTH